MDLLIKIIGFIIPSIAIILSFNARLKTFNNERMSVYKDIKTLSSELEMESCEIKVIDDELKKLILREVTGIFEIVPAKRFMKILSCNPNFDAIEKKRLKKIIRCISESEHLTEEEIEFNFKLNEELYKKRAINGTIFIFAFLLGYITFTIAGFSSIAAKDYLWGAAQAIISLASLAAMLVAKSS